MQIYNVTCFADWSKSHMLLSYTIHKSTQSHFENVIHILLLHWRLPKYALFLVVVKVIINPAVFSECLCFRLISAFGCPGLFLF